jgi:SOS-response transcriptional repressor LexA
MNILQRIYRFLVEYKVDNNGNSPTLREICEACTISSTSVAIYYLRKLQELGLIHLEGAMKSRSITVQAGRWQMMASLDEVLKTIPNTIRRHKGRAGSPPDWALSPTLNALEQVNQ